MSASRIPSLTEQDFPVSGSPRQKLGFALKYAALAPTQRSYQPWDFRLADTHIELIAQDDPALEANDPDGRELTIGCGAAMLYLKLALKHFGCLGRVALFPDLGQPKLVARVHFGFCGERNTQEKLLFGAMTQGRSSFSPPSDTAFSEVVLEVLSQAAAGERGWLDFVQSEPSRQRVMDITLAGDSHWRNFDPSFDRPNHPSAAGHSLPWLPPLFGFGGGNLDSREEETALVRQLSFPAATLAVVKTKTDEKHGWLAAGQTMARTVLQAQALGLSWAFFNPVRRREAREALRVRVGHKGFAQVILCFGSLIAGERVRSAAPSARPVAHEY